MATEIHFVDVGQGNMVLIKADDGSRFVFDCNITQDNESRVLGYVAKVFGRSNRIRAFICSHRDADHMRGVTKLHNKNPISEIWDSGYAGTTTGSPEYTQYMNLRRKVGVREIEKFTYENFGSTRFRYFSASDNRLPKNANAQGIVIKVEQRNPTLDECLTSALLPGDSDAEVWRDGILKDYSEENLKSSILMAAHHGSNSFFEIPSNQYRYTEHLRAIKPQMVVVSVGPNTHGHPKFEALGLYETYATGSIEGEKIARTDQNGTMKLTLNTDGRWRLNFNQ